MKNVSHTFNEWPTAVPGTSRNIRPAEWDRLAGLADLQAAWMLPTGISGPELAERVFGFKFRVSRYETMFVLKPTIFRGQPVVVVHHRDDDAWDLVDFGS